MVEERSTNLVRKGKITINGRSLEFNVERVTEHFKEMGRKREECKERGSHIPSGRFVDTMDSFRVTEYCAYCGFEYERYRQAGDPRSYVTHEDLQREVI